MPDETRQPFEWEEEQSRKPDDPELVGEVLGPRARAEMEEMVDGVEDQEPSLPDTDLTVLSSEQKEVVEAETDLVAVRKDQYIEWADKFGMDENWVDETFIFNPDGTVISVGDLRPSHYIGRFPDVELLPPFLVEAKGLIHLENCDISSLDGLPQETWKLVLGSNPIENLDDLPRKINGSLDLRDIPATSIPSGLKIAGTVYVNDDQFKLRRDIVEKGYKIRVVYL